MIKSKTIIRASMTVGVCALLLVGSYVLNKASDIDESNAEFDQIQMRNKIDSDTLLQSPSKVRELSTKRCGQNADCHTIAVSCGNIPERRALIQQFKLSDPSISKGTIILTTGGRGVAQYDDKEEMKETIILLRKDGFEVFAVSYLGEEGWAEGVGGPGQRGYKRAMCIYAGVVRYIHATLATNTDVLCAQGNSGGSHQIAYGLAAYGLDELFDMVILTGGPPIVRIRSYCFEEEFDDRQSFGFRFTDQLMGWTDNGDLCTRGGYPPNYKNKEGLISLVEGASLLSDTQERDLSYPNTKLNVVGGSLDDAYERGLEYYEAVTTEKNVYTIQGMGHGVSNHPKGAQKIRMLFREECYGR